MNKSVKKLMTKCHKEDVMGFNQAFNEVMQSKVIERVKNRLFKEETEDDDETDVLGTGRCPKCKEGCAVVNMDGTPSSNCCSASMRNEEWSKEE